MSISEDALELGKRLASAGGANLSAKNRSAEASKRKPICATLDAEPSLR
jgi:hypothetical protein